MRKGSFASGEFYHVYNRGTEKRDIFCDSFDYERFTALLYIANGTKPVRIENVRRREQGRTLLKELDGFDRGETLVDIVVYCLMPNHIHLLIRAKNEAGVSRFMQKLMTAYTMYFNTKYQRNGVLFQGKFKDSHVDSDRYLKYLISYIHLNPVKLIQPAWKERGIRNRGAVGKFLEEYSYSSYLDYIGSVRMPGGIIEQNILLDYFDGKPDFRAYIREWLAYKDSV